MTILSRTVGSMREVVRIESRTTSQDANGEQVASWSLVLERRAQMVATPGAELWSSKERTARVPTVFRMRYPTDAVVLPQMRLVCRGRVFNIISAIDESGRRTDLLVSCEELIGEPT